MRNVWVQITNGGTFMRSNSPTIRGRRSELTDATAARAIGTAPAAPSAAQTADSAVLSCATVAEGIARPQACPVESLLREAGKIRRALLALRGASDLRAELDATNDQTGAEEIQHALRERFRAIEQIAAQRHATSRLGAAFQLYIAAARTQDLVADQIGGAPETRQGHDPLAAGRMIARLQYAGLAALTADLHDADLELLRSYYLPDGWSTLDLCDQVLARVN